MPNKIGSKLSSIRAWIDDRDGYCPLSYVFDSERSVLTFKEFTRWRGITIHYVDGQYEVTSRDHKYDDLYSSQSEVINMVLNPVAGNIYNAFPSKKKGDNMEIYKLAAKREYEDEKLTSDIGLYQNADIARRSIVEFLRDEYGEDLADATSEAITTSSSLFIIVDVDNDKVYDKWDDVSSDPGDIGEQIWFDITKEPVHDKPVCDWTGWTFTE